MMEKENMKKENMEEANVSPQNSQETAEAASEETTATEVLQERPAEAKKDNENPSGKKKKKKKQNMTVEQVLAAGNVLEKDALGNDVVKIHVKQKSKLKRREARMGYFFCFPWIVGACTLLLYPLVRSFWFMLCDVRTTAFGLTETFVGAGNFQKVMNQETTFITDLGAFATRMVVSVPVIVVFALLMAMLLNLNLRGKGIFRTIYFLPVIVVSGPVMGMLNGEGAGAISAIDTTSITNTVNSMLPGFLSSGILWALNSIVMILWYAGVQILIFLAAIQKIDTSLYEAAKIDGGSGWECFWKITLPTIKPMILLNALYTLIFLSGDTNSNIIIVTIKNVMFEARKGYGYATAMAWMYSAIVLIMVGIIALLFAPRKDAYIKQMKKQKRFEKQTRKNLKKSQKRMARNNAKFAKHVEKQQKAIAAGKKVKGGRD